MLMCHYMERNVEWRERWLYPLLEVIANDTNWKIFEGILIDLLRSRCHIVADIRNWYELNRKQRLPVYVSALLAGKRQGIFLNNSENYAEETQKIAQEAIDHSDWRV